MTETTSELELILFLYKEPKLANEALTKARELQKSGEIQLVDAAVITKTQDGKAGFHEIHDVGVWRGSLFGFVAGALIGLIGGPVGVLLGGAMGAAAGGAVAGELDLGFSNQFLNDLKSALQPGCSALLVIVEPPNDDLLIHAQEPLSGQVYRHLLRADVVDQLREAERRASE
jgi:uncharacterized membrane protein